jgi:hypothetical protein
MVEAQELTARYNKVPRSERNRQTSVGLAPPARVGGEIGFLQYQSTYWLGRLGTRSAHLRPFEALDADWKKPHLEA